MGCSVQHRVTSTLPLSFVYLLMKPNDARRNEIVRNRLRYRTREFITPEDLIQLNVQYQNIVINRMEVILPHTMSKEKYLITWCNQRNTLVVGTDVLLYRWGMIDFHIYYLWRFYLDWIIKKVLYATNIIRTNIPTFNWNLGIIKRFFNPINPLFICTIN